MPTHQYSRLPGDDPLNHLNRSYYTGLPSTAPPSFHSVALSQDNLPHRNDETAATIIPPRLPPTAEDNAADPEISTYAPSSSVPDMDLEAAREDTVARLVDTIALIQRRVDEQAIKMEEGFKSTRGKPVPALVGLWVLCIIGIVVYFTRPVSGQK